MVWHNCTQGLHAEYELISTWKRTETIFDYIAKEYCFTGLKQMYIQSRGLWLVKRNSERSEFHEGGLNLWGIVGSDLKVSNGTL